MPDLNVTITCPHCGRATAEMMPTDRCVYFYECIGCKVLLKPTPGDCCVFCSFGDRACPSRQTLEASQLGGRVRDGCRRGP